MGLWPVIGWPWRQGNPGQKIDAQTSRARTLVRSGLCPAMFTHAMWRGVSA